MNYWKLLLCVIVLIVFSGCSEPTPPGVQNGEGVFISVDEMFPVNAYSNSSTGYEWNVKISDETIVVFEGDETLSCGAGVGSGCDVKYLFKGLKAGTTNIHMEYKRPFEPLSQPLEVVDFMVTVS